MNRYLVRQHKFYFILFCSYILLSGISPYLFELSNIEENFYNITIQLRHSYDISKYTRTRGASCLIVFFYADKHDFVGRVMKMFFGDNCSQKVAREPLYCEQLDNRHMAGLAYFSSVCSIWWGLPDKTIYRVKEYDTSVILIFNDLFVDAVQALFVINVSTGYVSRHSVKILKCLAHTLCYNELFLQVVNIVGSLKVKIVQNVIPA